MLPILSLRLGTIARTARRCSPAVRFVFVVIVLILAAIVSSMLNVRAALPDIGSVIDSKVAPHVADVLPLRAMRPYSGMPFKIVVQGLGDPDKVSAGSWPESPQMLSHRWQFVWFCVFGGHGRPWLAYRLSGSPSDQPFWYWQDLFACQLISTVAGVVLLCMLGKPCRFTIVFDLILQCLLATSICLIPIPSLYYLFHRVWLGVLIELESRGIYRLEYVPSQTWYILAAWCIVYGLVVVVVIRTVLRRRNQGIRLASDGKCVRCGYASESSICSECGLDRLDPTCWPPHLRLSLTRTISRNKLHTGGRLGWYAAVALVTVLLFWPVIRPMIANVLP